jgi:3-hydroxyisobutyrate dehydrogenase
MAKPRIAFFGLGTMGSGMVRRLLGAGFPVNIYNRNAAKAEPFRAEGAVIAPTPCKAAENAGVLISMLADDDASAAVWSGDNGALHAVQRGAVLIESSTVSVKWINALAGEASARGCELLDAPVTGSRPQAAAGELCFLVGGPAAALEEARPVLEAMSRTIFHLGPTGSGALMKLINNFLCGVQAASLAEAVGIIEKAGLDRAQALEILTTGAPGSPLVKAVSGRMTTREYSPPYFFLHLMAKDIAYAAAEGNIHGLNPLTAAAALQIFQHAIAHGDGDRDMAAIIEQFRTS